MKEKDLRTLATVGDRVVAENIQSILEESEIYTMLVSDNPAATIMTAYSGLNAIESVDIQINKNDYQRAVEILSDSPYKELLAE